MSSVQIHPSSALEFVLCCCIAFASLYDLKGSLKLFPKCIIYMYVHVCTKFQFTYQVDTLSETDLKCHVHIYVCMYMYMYREDICHYCVYLVNAITACSILNLGASQQLHTP